MKKTIESAKYIQKRGPDRCTSIIKSSGIYIFYRLSIVDPSIHGDQPMFRGSVVMMCNGEIYNHKQLEIEYDVKCNSGSDCEIIIELYKKIGFVEAVKKLDGVYAIVLVDNDRVYMARDRIGVRPLFFGITAEKHLAVASEPRALVEICSIIRELEPGSSVVHDKNDKKSILMYLEKKSLPINKPLSTLNEYGSLKQVIVNAIRKRLMTDRPIGCLLSGGLDSSIVAAVLVQLLGAENVRTYSIGMTDSTDLNYARKMADFLKTEHTEVTFTPEEGLAVIPEIIANIGSYDITTIRASVGMYLISRYISRNTADKVIFSGEGSDELFCGYLYFHNAPSEDDAHKESINLLSNLHLYDVLRADRTITSWGLELRVPFLDSDVVDYGLGMTRRPKNGFEKYELRKAFENDLPVEIVWRRKEGFSDGVSGLKKSWYQFISEEAERKIPNEIFGGLNSFPSKEAMYYYLIFCKEYGSYRPIIPYWMPKWSGDSTDPSGRLIQIDKNE